MSVVLGCGLLVTISEVGGNNEVLLGPVDDICVHHDSGDDPCVLWCVMRVDDYSEQKMLFQLDGWYVLKWNTFDGSFVKHARCNFSIESSLLSTNPYCRECKEFIPKSILCVWVMLNFDRIQQNKELFDSDSEPRRV